MQDLLPSVAVTVALVVTWKQPSRSFMRWLVLTAAGAALGSLILHAVHWLWVNHPGVLPGEPADGYIGVLVAQCLFLPAVVTLLVPDTSWYPLVLAWLEVSPFLVVEYLITWWADDHPLPPRLLLFLPITLTLFITANCVRRGRLFPRTERVAATLLIAGFIVVWHAWVVLMSAGLGWWQMRTLLLSSPTWDSIFSTFLYHGLPFLSLGVPMTWFRLVTTPGRVCVPVVVLFVWLSALRLTGLWSDRSPWGPLAESVSLGIMIYLFGWLRERLDPRVSAV